jgi:iron complex outermembrane receptor protein
MRKARTPLYLALAAVFPLVAQAREAAPETVLSEVVVTASQMEEPLKVVTDPKAPRQPVPAHDGADYLKTIPGFSVIRKGGTDGDPVLRGMAGSRLNILLDGEQILGGCGMRMDPPTAYVFPEAYDRITVIKGPQSVLYGAGSSAGTVLFERDVRRLKEPGWKFNGSLLFGSFGRNDQVADLRAGTPDFYVQGIATNSDADDYKDGDGRAVHSRFTRWSANAALDWTSDEDTRLELSAARSDGEAAYADRSMDGVKFARENVGVKFEKRRLSPLVEKLEAQAYYNYIDHVMDNYSLRPQAAASRALNNPDRETTGARVAITLRQAEATRVALGADIQRNIHTLRTASAMAGNLNTYTSAPRIEDASFRNYGLFGELTLDLGERDRIIAGLRADRWHAKDARTTTVTAGQSRRDTLSSGFARYEHDLPGGQTTAYAGLGHAERFPDYWELISAGKQSLATNSAFLTAPEKTTQLDAGLIHGAGALSGSLSAFYNRIRDFILTDTLAKPGFTVTRNIDATTWGGEAGLVYRFGEAWKADATLAYVRGDNDSDGTPLAQLPPLEARLGLNYDDKRYAVGALLRLVAEQDRFDRGRGNIVGQDIGRTPGFAVFSLNAGWRPSKGVLIAAGIDNLFDRTYAEHISRAGAMVSGFTQTTRVNEPGRNLWVKLNLALE